MMKPILKPVAPWEWPEVARVFWDTFVLGSPVPFPVGSRAAYEGLVLDWYRNNPGDSRVVVADGVVVGYVLVCTEQRLFEKDQRKAAGQYLRTVLPRVVAAGISSAERRFLAYRLADGYEAWRDEDPRAVGAHAHFNLASGYRSGLVVRDLVEHIDEACRRAGLTHWTGQINARVGRRLGLLRRYGFHVDTRTRNRTLTWLAGTPVERITVVREVGVIQRLDLAS